MPLRKISIENPNSGDIEYEVFLNESSNSIEEVHQYNDFCGGFCPLDMKQKEVWPFFLWMRLKDKVEERLNEFPMLYTLPNDRPINSSIGA